MSDKPTYREQARKEMDVRYPGNFKPGFNVDQLSAPAEAPQQTSEPPAPPPQPVSSVVESSPAPVVEKTEDVEPQTSDVPISGGRTYDSAPLSEPGRAAPLPPRRFGPAPEEV